MSATLNEKQRKSISSSGKKKSRPSHTGEESSMGEYSSSAPPFLKQMGHSDSFIVTEIIGDNSIVPLDMQTQQSENIGSF